MRTGSNVDGLNGHTAGCLISMCEKSNGVASHCSVIGGLGISSVAVGLENGLAYTGCGSSDNIPEQGC